MNVNAETLNRLVISSHDDEDMLEMIEDAMNAFEAYHAAIYRLEMKRKIYSNGTLDAKDYQSMIQELDRTRTSYHNALLVHVNILNRMAKGEGLPPFYDGTVSEERPYRREVANAVLAYVEDIIKNRS